MKILLTFFVLYFSLSVLAEDISDFEIEGISIFDSLLDHYSEEEILNGSITNYPNSNKFFDIGFLTINKNINSNNDAYIFSVKKNDSEYKINNIRGVKFYENEISKCLEFKKNLINDLNVFSENVKREDYEYNYDKLADGKSMSYVTSYYFESGSIRIYCNEWSKKTKKQYNQRDAFAFEISTQEILEWIDNEAY